ncbi:transporter substrate-binding domain-containing protein [Saccharopolyspora shandongensis]|uniref:transporter substrate-binding domain-containing protein n=1 Tax=Saccharopolyspora shandongensis TaxID=418495 RepID=UPI0034056854
MKARAISFLSLLLLVAGCSGSSDLFQDPKFARFGVKADQPGLAGPTQDPNTPDGFEIQIAWTIARHFDRDASFQHITSATREKKLQTGEMNVVIASYSMTDPRRAEVDMVGPYLRSRSGIMVRSDYDGPDEVHSFSGADVCTADGTTSVDLIEKELNDQKPQTAPSFGGCIEMLRQHKVKAVMTDKIILEGFVRKSEGEFSLLAAEFGPEGYYGIAIPKNHRAECLEIMGIVKNYVSSTDWKRDFDTHFPGVKPDDYAVGPAQVDAKSTCSP